MTTRLVPTAMEHLRGGVARLSQLIEQDTFNAARAELMSCAIYLNARHLRRAYVVSATRSVDTHFANDRSLAGYVAIARCRAQARGYARTMVELLERDDFDPIRVEKTALGLYAHCRRLKRALESS